MAVASCIDEVSEVAELSESAKFISVESAGRAVDESVAVVSAVVEVSASLESDAPGAGL